MAQNEPPGEFDYLWRDLDDKAGYYGFDDGSEAETSEPWAPWYRTTQAVVAMSAIGGAVVAIVVSAVLLVSQQFRSPTPIEPPTTTTPSATATPPLSTSPPITSEVPSTTPPSNTVPVIVQPPVKPSPTRPPEIGVTRTPTTRTPISVHPAPQPVPHY
jgi:hypothetical protein